MQFKICTCLLVGWCTAVSANPCTKLGGHWQGQWQQGKQHFATSNLIISMRGHLLQGHFSLTKNSKGTFHGKCISINNDEAYIVLQPDPPDYNPCRGNLFIYNHQPQLRFFCYQPDAWGHYKKA